MVGSRWWLPAVRRGGSPRKHRRPLIRDVGGRTSCNHGPAGVARAGFKIDHVIGHRDNAHVQLRGDDRVARIEQRFVLARVPRRGGQAQWWQALVALVLLLALTVVVLVAATRIYRRALLQTSGKLGYKEAWNAEI